jgi:hypothetical protein
MFKKILLLSFLALSACAEKTGNFYGTVKVGTKHPEISFIENRLIEGENTSILTIDSYGGSTDQWRKLVELSDKIGIVVLKNECDSACLLFAVSISNKGVPVYLKGNVLLQWHGQIKSDGSTLDSNDKAVDTLAWLFVGLPAWAFDKQNSLASGQLIKMSQEEIKKAGFLQYQ